MARQTERERALMIARKKVGYEELIAVKTNEDVEMRDVEMEEVRMGDEDEVAAQVSVLSQLSISACAKKAPQAPRRILQATGPRGRGKFRFQSNIYTASDQVHQRGRLHDPDNMADDRRGGGGYNNRKRRYNRDDDEGGYDRRPQRRRYEDAPPGTRLRRQLLSVAESPMKNPEDEVTEIAKLVTENYHDNYVKETYCDLVLSLVLEQPFKIPFVAASVLCANN
ncbi:hypothetical protein KCU79_g17774, partial [Aureobasidium melanogenum]